MLFDHDTLDAVRDGRVSVAFRRWAAPRVKAGTRLRTRVGIVEVERVDEIDPGGVGDGDIDAAGFPGREAWSAWVEQRPGHLYRIEVRWVGEDPRIALRQRSDLAAPEAADLQARLARMDTAADVPWTTATLHLIEANPGMVSTELASMLGLPRHLFKRRVRRLKEFGLTESLGVGYRISPRGRALLGYLDTAHEDGI